jgi:membrane-bound ClpP family serine protease
MRNHGLWMVIGCILPLLLIFMLFGLGVRGNQSFFILIILMFGLHLLMMGRHHGNHGKHDEEKEEKHGQH